MEGARLRRLFGGLHVDLARGDHRRSVLISGSPRSGTTWLSELVNHDNSYRRVFEPFHPGKVRDFRAFQSRQYLRPDDRRGEYLEPVRRALSGELRSRWTDRGGPVLAGRRLVKEVRANLLLGWISANFPGLPIVLLLRNPRDVVASRLALGWGDNLSGTMGQEDLVRDHLLPMEAGIRAAADPFERHLFLWCIDNYVPLRQLSPNDAHLLFYENLVHSPEKELRSLFAYLGEPFAPNVLSRLDLPSPTSRKDAEPRPEPAGRRERTAEVLSLFGLDRIYGEGTMPDPDAARAVMTGVGAGG